MTGPDDGVVRVATAEFVETLAGIAGQLVSGCWLARGQVADLSTTAEGVVDDVAYALRSGPLDEDDSRAVLQQLQSMLEDSRAHDATLVAVGQGVAVLAQALGQLQSGIRKALS